MMRSNRPRAATAPRKSHGTCTPCEHHVWRWRVVCQACELRAVVAARGRFDRIIVCVCMCMCAYRIVVRSTRGRLDKLGLYRCLYGPRAAV
eukprot:2339444-Lingulodinium_polyedra.AAC.1